MLYRKKNEVVSFNFFSITRSVTRAKHTVYTNIMSLVDMHNLYLTNSYSCNKFFFELTNCFLLEFCSKLCLFNTPCFALRYHWEDHHMHVVGAYGPRDLRSFVFLCVFLTRCLNWRWATTLLWPGYSVRAETGSSIRKWLSPVNSGADTYKSYPRVTAFLFTAMASYFCSQVQLSSVKLPYLKLRA